MENLFSKIFSTFAFLFFITGFTYIPAQAQMTFPNPVTTTPVQSAILIRGDQIVSQDGRFHLIFENSGNFVLYQGSTVLWSTGTGPQYQTITPPGGTVPITFVSYPCHVAFQADGNLVVYTSSGVVGAPAGPCNNVRILPSSYGVAWRTNTYMYPNAKLWVQDDGNVVIYDSSNIARWSTKTCCH